MFVEGGSNLLADELLTLDIEQSPHVGDVIRKEFEGVFVYWVNLSDDIPNVRALFYIKGKQFICEKITATFNEHGMSQLLKGDFYEVVG